MYLPISDTFVEKLLKFFTLSASSGPSNKRGELEAVFLQVGALGSSPNDRHWGFSGGNHRILREFKDFLGFLMWKDNWPIRFFTWESHRFKNQQNPWESFQLPRWFCRGLRCEAHRGALDRLHAVHLAAFALWCTPDTPTTGWTAEEMWQKRKNGEFSRRVL